MTTAIDVCSHCRTTVTADLNACPKCGAKRKIVEAETGSGREAPIPVLHIVAVIAGMGVGFLITRFAMTPPVGIGTTISTTICGGGIVGLALRYIDPRGGETKKKTIWVRRDF